MPLFHLHADKLTTILPGEFATERELQRLIEQNLLTVFNCRFIATEFPTGARHAGRIDTLALSEENNPVIIEYKKVASSELINQGLYYLSWMDDHRGDFQVAVEKKLGKKTEVDWSDIRVICIAPSYKKFDLHAVQMMGANIELWEYRLYENGSFFLEEIFKRGGETINRELTQHAKDPKMIEAGRKAAITRKSGVTYTFEEHATKAQGELEELVNEFRDFVLSLSDSIEELPKKLYVAYKVTQNFVCLEVHHKKFYLYLKAAKEDFDSIPQNGRDVRSIGHFGTGDLEITISNRTELEESKALVLRALSRVGGG